MRKSKLGIAALSIGLVLLLGAALFLALMSANTPVVSAQAGTDTPTPGGGLQTIQTATPAAADEEAAAATPAAEDTAMPAGAPEAQMDTVTGLARTITVVGQGSANLSPDRAQATIGVEVVTDTVRTAAMQASEVMSDVIQALIDAGVAEEDIQTSGYNIFAERFFPNGQPGAGEERVRYHVSNTALVTIRNLDSIGAILDAAIEAGANNIYGVNFSIEDPGDAERQAFDEAMADAQNRAEYLAGLAGVSVGPVVSISEVIGTGPGPIFRDVAQGLGGGGAGPISPGQLEVMRQLQVVFELR